MPTIRVGVVLPEDGRDCVELEVPPRSYDLMAEDEAVTHRALSGGRVAFAIAGGEVCARVGSEHIGTKAVWGVESPRGLKPTALSGLLLRNARVGRGFHWEKAIDLHVPGDVAVSVVQGRLLLVARMPVEDYLLGVITSEMAGACPLEFLKAQCVVARSWTLAHTEHKHDDLGIDYCNDDCCQRFHGVGAASATAVQAVAETAGEVLLARDGSIVDANYSKCCGGITEDPRFVWGRPKPGLSSHADAPPSSPLGRMVPIGEANLSDYLGGRWLGECDAWCSPNSVPADALAEFLGRVDNDEGFFRWRVSYRREELEDILRTKLRTRSTAPPAHELERLQDLRVTARGSSGRATELTITYVDLEHRKRAVTVSDQYNIRRALHASFLYSSAFEVEIVRQADGAPREIILTGAGWGHGAGFCQLGALGMVLGGAGYREILAHYFREATLHLFTRGAVV